MKYQWIRRLDSLLDTSAGILVEGCKPHVFSSAHPRVNLQCVPAPSPAATTGSVFTDVSYDADATWWRAPF